MREGAQKEDAETCVFCRARIRSCAYTDLCGMESRFTVLYCMHDKAGQGDLRAAPQVRMKRFRMVAIAKLVSGGLHAYHLACARVKKLLVEHEIAPSPCFPCGLCAVWGT